MVTNKRTKKAKRKKIILCDDCRALTATYQCTKCGAKYCDNCTMDTDGFCELCVNRTIEEIK